MNSVKFAVTNDYFMLGLVALVDALLVDEIS